jgi:hypothetical protein
MLPPILPAPSFLPAAPSCLLPAASFLGLLLQAWHLPSVSRLLQACPPWAAHSCLPGLSYSLVMASAMASSLLPTSISSDLFTLLKIHLATS